MKKLLFVTLFVVTVVVSLPLAAADFVIPVDKMLPITVSATDGYGNNAGSCAVAVINDDGAPVVTSISTVDASHFLLYQIAGTAGTGRVIISCGTLQVVKSIDFVAGSVQSLTVTAGALQPR